MKALSAGIKEKMNLMIDSYGENYATASGNIELSVLTFKTV